MSPYRPGRPARWPRRRRGRSAPPCTTCSTGGPSACTGRSTPAARTASWPSSLWAATAGRRSGGCVWAAAEPIPPRCPGAACTGSSTPTWPVRPSRWVSRFVPGPLVVVDAPFVLYRSFFALPDSIKGEDDRPVNALLGAVNVLLRIAADRGPRAIVACFGAESARYRVEMFAPYHADRPPVPDDLAWQFAQAPALFEAFGWASLNSEDLEADDLLGALAREEQAAGGETLIVTGDRDMYQCAGERVHVLYLKSGTTGFEEVDRDEVKRRYGVAPELVPDFI